MRHILFAITMLMLCLSVNGQELKVTGSRKAIRTSGDVLVFITPVASLATVLATQDWQGLKQGVFTGVTTLGVTYALKYLVKKERPTSAIIIRSHPCIPPYPSRELLLSKGVMDGNGVFRLMPCLPTWVGAGSMERSMIGGTWRREPLSAPVAPISLPARSQRNITCLSAR